jgi:hypothetical protein
MPTVNSPGQNPSLMKSKLLIIHLLLLFTGPMMAQVTFERAYGGTSNDEGYEARPAGSDRYIVTGNTTNNNSGDHEVFLLCVDQNGDTIWSRTLVHPGVNDEGVAVVLSNDGNYVVAVNTRGVPANAGFYKFSQTGDSTWAHHYTGFSGNDYATSAVQSPDSGFMMCGYTTSTKKGPLATSQMFIQKADASGNYQWRKNFPATGFDGGYGIDNTSDSGFILCGDKDTPGQDEDAWLMKINAAGDKQWEKFFGDPSALEGAVCVRRVPDGGYILCGTWYNGFTAVDAEIYVVKTDEGGNLEWSAKYGGTGNDYGISIDYTSDGGYIVLGETNSFTPGTENYDLYLLRVDQDGDTLWTRTFGGPNREGGGSVFHTDDGGFLVCGYTTSFGHGAKDVYLVKTNENGVVTASGATQIRHNHLQINPNPATCIVTVTAPVNFQRFLIADTRGHIVASGDGQPAWNPLKIDLTAFHPGVYILQLFTETGVLTEKVIKTD